MHFEEAECINSIGINSLNFQIYWAVDAQKQGGGIGINYPAALHEYNTKQARPERRIDDYFEHVSDTEQDMAVEIIIQCGDKKFWEQNRDDRIFMKQVYKQLLLKLQEYLPLYSQYVII